MDIDYSFTTVAIQNKTFCEILSKYKNAIDTLPTPYEQGGSGVEIKVNGDKAKIYVINLGEYLPTRKNQIVGELIYILSLIYDESDELYDTFETMIEEIQKSKKRIEADMEFIKVIASPEKSYDDDDDYDEDDDFMDDEDDAFMGCDDDSEECDMYVYKDGKGTKSKITIDDMYHQDFMDDD